MRKTILTTFTPTPPPPGKATLNHCAYDRLGRRADPAIATPPSREESHLRYHLAAGFATMPPHCAEQSRRRSAPSRRRKSIRLASPATST
ncbi:unnamed protein product [Urochloa humidicola]